MSQYDWIHCPQIVQQQAYGFIRQICNLLPDSVVGIYLHGSLAMGCFNPLRSDLDFIVVIREQPQAAMNRALIRLLLETSRQPSPIEISILRWSQLHPWQHPASFDFHYSEAWRLRVASALENENWHPWNDPVQVDGDLAGHLTVTRRRGLCLYGSSIEQVIPPIPEADFVDSILGDVLDDFYGLNVETTFPVNVVLNACRTCAYLMNGSVLSKDEGGVWALGMLPAQFHPVIERALHAYRYDANDDHLPGEIIAGFVVYMRQEIARLQSRRA